MHESNPNVGGAPRFSRRQMLQTGLGFFALLVSSEQSAEAAEPLRDADFTAAMSRFFELSQTPIEPQPLTHRDSALEHHAAMIGLLAQPLLDLEATDDQRRESMKSLIDALPKPQTSSNERRTAALELLQRLHMFRVQLAQAGYYLDIAPQLLATKQTNGEIRFKSLTFAPVNLRFITAVEQRVAPNFWDEQTLGYSAVTLGLDVQTQSGQPTVPFHPRSGGLESGVSTEHDVMIIDSVRRNPAVVEAEFRGLQDRLRTQSQFDRVARMTVKEVLWNFATVPPSQIPVLAAERFAAKLKDRILSVDYRQVRVAEELRLFMHEASHMFFNRREDFKQVLVAPSDRSILDANNFQQWVDNRGVTAEIGGELGGLIFSSAEIAQDVRWLPLYQLLQAVHKKKEDPHHGLAAEWILRELVARVVARPSDFGLALSDGDGGKQQQEVWAQLDVVFDKTDPDVLRATWIDIAKTYRTSFNHQFINAAYEVQPRPIETEVYRPAVHSDWFGLVGKLGTAAAAAIGALEGLRWRKNTLKSREANEPVRPSKKKRKK